MNNNESRHIQHFENLLLAWWKNAKTATYRSIRRLEESLGRNTDSIPVTVWHVEYHNILYYKLQKQTEWQKNLSECFHNIWSHCEMFQVMSESCIFQRKRFICNYIIYHTLLFCVIYVTKCLLTENFVTV